MKSNNKVKVPKRKPKGSTDAVETSLTIKLDDALKKKFLDALSKGRPSSYTHALKELMAAYCEATERNGKQPEFPLEVRTREAEKKAGG